jgi:hypothetical protein
MNEPIGRFGSCRPVAARRSAFATASTASSWPTTRSCRRSSMWISFSGLALEQPLDRDPRPAADDAATSSSSTSSLTIGSTVRDLPLLSSCSSAGSSP